MIYADATELTVLSQKFKRLPARMTAIIYPELKQLGGALSTYMRKEMQPVKFTGELERSVSSRIIMGRGTFQVSVGPTAEHAIYIRFGTRPRNPDMSNAPPIDAIRRWVEYKIPGADPSMPYRIQRGIVKHGTSVGSLRRYGTMSNPFNARTMARGDTKRSVQTFGIRVLKAIAKEFSR
jgi:hypothetical protein